MVQGNTAQSRRRSLCSVTLSFFLRRFLLNFKYHTKQTRQQTRALHNNNFHLCSSFQVQSSIFRITKKGASIYRKRMQKARTVFFLSVRTSHSLPQLSCLFFIRYSGRDRSYSVPNFSARVSSVVSSS